MTQPYLREGRCCGPKPSDIPSDYPRSLPRCVRWIEVVRFFWLLLGFRDGSMQECPDPFFLSFPPFFS